MITKFHFMTIATMEYHSAEAFLILLITINDSPNFEPTTKHLLKKVIALP
jgi:hypothetical protein